MGQSCIEDRSQNQCAPAYQSTTYLARKADDLTFISQRNKHWDLVNEIHDVFCNYSAYSFSSPRCSYSTGKPRPCLYILSKSGLSKCSEKHWYMHRRPIWISNTFKWQLKVKKLFNQVFYSLMMQKPCAYKLLLSQDLVSADSYVSASFSGDLPCNGKAAAGFSTPPRLEFNWSHKLSA